MTYINFNFFSIKNKEEKFKNISLLVLCIFSSFFCGNYFGIYSKILENSFLFITLNIFVVEIINFVIYSKLDKILVKVLLIALKRGFLIGIFVEAYKVGS